MATAPLRLATYGGLLGNWAYRACHLSAHYPDTPYGGRVMYPRYRRRMHP